MRKKKIYFDTFIYLLFSFFIFIDFFRFFLNKSILVNFSFLIIGVISFILFIKDNRFLSINKLIFAFIFLFCYLAPLHQYHANHTFWGDKPYSDDEYLYGNILLIIFILTYVITYKYSFKNKKMNLLNKNKYISISDVSIFIFLIISFMCLFYLYISGNLRKLENIENTDSLFLFFIKIIRFFPVASLLIVLYTKKSKTLMIKKKYEKIYYLLMSGIILLIFFPLNGTINRYLLFGTYIILASVLFEKIQKKSLLLIALVIGFGILFPSFNFFKYHTFSEIRDFKLYYINYTTNDFDAYQMFLRTIRYVKTDGILAGGNILTAIFCFVPRSIWGGKLYPSGELISKSLDLNFGNVSCPIFAEFYLSFGLIGLILLTFVFSRIIKFIEKRAKDKYIIYQCVNSILIGLIIAIIRGALLPVFSFTFSLMLSLFVSYFVVAFTNKKFVSKLTS